jgi:hypothetical protein
MADTLHIDNIIIIIIIIITTINVESQKSLILQTALYAPLTVLAEWL